MKSRFRITLSLLAFAVILVPEARPQGGETGNIIGRVTISRASFPPHVMVTITTRGITVNSSYTDDEGKFAFYNLTTNVYHVLINDERFQPVDALAQVNALIVSNTMVNIILVPKEAAKQTPDRQQTSSGNPYVVDTAEYTKHYPKEAVKEYEKGSKSSQKGEQEDAIKHYGKAVNVAPDFYEARNGLGLAYLSKLNFVEAQKQFEEAIRVNQGDSQAYFNLGNLFLLQKRYEDAEHAIQEGLRRQPNSAFGEMLLGTVYGRTGNAQQAEHSLRQALQLDPKLSKAHLELVNLYLQQQKPSDAATELRAFLKAAPNDPLAPKAKEVLQKLEKANATATSQK